MKLKNIVSVLVMLVMLGTCAGIAADNASSSSKKDSVTVSEAVKKSDDGDKITPCTVCHGDKGNSVNPVWPKLNGQHELYLKSQLLAFKQGAKSGRSDPLMDAAVAALTPEDIANLAAYFANQKSTLNLASPDQVVLGGKIYYGGNQSTGLPACSACHGPRGEGNAQAKFPRLSGQHAKYITAQLQQFKTHKRTNDYNGMMQDIASLMTEEEMKAVSSYIAGLN